jgi:hypothetical protein
MWIFPRAHSGLAQRMNHSSRQGDEGRFVEARDWQNALATLIETLEESDGYEGRSDLTVSSVIVQDRSEGIEHPMMTLEWVIEAAISVSARRA